MNPLAISVALVLLVGVRAQLLVQLLNCDSPEVEEVALVARDYLNAQHTHGYKYELNRIEDVKFYSTGTGDDDTYVLEVDLLETRCHALDPTPLANCTVRPKHLTAVEGDCDVVLKKVGGVLTVTAFKCKTEESREDFCLGCPTLLPLKDIDGLNFVKASLATFNNKNTTTAPFVILQVGRMSSQVVSGGPLYSAEYVIVEANCTGGDCVELTDPTAARGFCTAQGRDNMHTVNCKMFSNLVPIVDTNTTVAAVLPDVNAQGGVQPHKHGLRHHKLTTFHNPHLSTHLSAESLESGEIVPVVPAVGDAAVPAPAADVVPAAADPAVALDSSNSAEVPLRFLFKRDVPATPAVPVDAVLPEPGPGPILPAPGPGPILPAPGPGLILPAPGPGPILPAPGPGPILPAPGPGLILPAPGPGPNLPAPRCPGNVRFFK